MFYCYFSKMVILFVFFLNNLAIIKVLQEMLEGCFGNCRKMSLANKWVTNIVDCIYSVSCDLWEKKKHAALVLMFYVFKVIFRVKI